MFKCKFTRLHGVTSRPWGALLPLARSRIYTFFNVFFMFFNVCYVLNYTFTLLHGFHARASGGPQAWAAPVSIFRGVKALSNIRSSLIMAAMITTKHNDLISACADLLYSIFCCTIKSMKYNTSRKIVTPKKHDLKFASAWFIVQHFSWSIFFYLWKHYQTFDPVW